MGPRLFSRGNDANLLIPRGLAEPSMGPRLFSRGNPLASQNLGPSASHLQWGRDSSVAEMTEGNGNYTGGGTTFNGAATLQSRKYP